MRNRLYAFFVIIFLLTACSRPDPGAAVTVKPKLWVYRAEPSALLQLSEDFSRVERQTPLPLPPACTLSNLFPSPAGETLLAELSCPNGPAAALVEPREGSLKMLIPDRSIDSHFLSWSPDGKSVYLRIASMTDPRILRVEAGSLRQAVLSIDPYTYDMSIAADERHMLFSFSRGMGLGSELWVAKPDGSGPRRILAEVSIIAYARTSPSADKIAFIKIPDTNVPFSVGELWLVDGRGGNTRKLADADAGHGYAPTWSPDGKQIAFVVRANPEDPLADQSVEALVSNIAVVEVASGAVRSVTHFEQGRASTPVWSPDGNTLTFAYVLDGRMDVQIADPTGDSAPSVIAQGSGYPVWMRK